jgi:uncharacterized protein (UPF0332 family)
VKKGRMPRRVIDLLDRFRNLRHTDLYQLDFFVTKDEAEESIRSTEFVIREITQVIRREHKA